jgi:long-subunit acyl-CoA synthetase (AMP-forming)
LREPRTLADLACRREHAAGDRRWLTQPMGNGRVATWTWREAVGEARRMAAHLVGLRLPPRSNIALCSKNCAWWFMADLAIWMAGHVTVPVYPNLSVETVRYILDHSQPRLLFVGKLDPVWEEMRQGVPAGLPCVAFPLSPARGSPGWDEVVAAQPPLAEPVERSPEEVATIIYTSGTTGAPKGAMISFGAMSAVARNYVSFLGTTAADRVLSYLPLAHAFERTSEAGSFHAGYQVFFAESLDTFLADLRRARPTKFLSVPQLWIKFRSGVLQKVPPAKLDRLLRIPVLRGLVKKRILRELGLDRVTVAASGSAPLPAEVVAWYRRLGLELLEGYAMTENFCYSHASQPGRVRPGCVGPPLPGVECRLSAEGEILVKSPGTMLGYFRDPAHTAEAFTEDGFLRTGDLGVVDPDGQLRITGRIKELFKTSKGNYVAPALIENRLLTHPWIEHCCVCGSGEPQPHALVVLSEEARELAVERRTSALESGLRDHLQAVNRELDAGEQLGFLAVVDDVWSPENGFLTPTLKVRRARIESAYGSLAPRWREQRRPIVWVPGERAAGRPSSAGAVLPGSDPPRAAP